MNARIEGIERVQRTMDRIARKSTPQKFRQIMRQVGAVALRQLVFATPVDLGTHRGGWVVTLTPNGPLPGPKGMDRTGGGTVAAGMAVMRAVAGNGTITIGNNRPAIRVLDEGLFDPPNPGPSEDPRDGREGRILVRGGYSVQAEEGMTVLAIRAVRSSLARIVSDIARRRG